jgi:phage FluMu protein Com
MSTASTIPCTCKRCNALLARLDRDGLCIRRNDLQVVVTGDSVVSVTCYRCKTLNVLSSRTPSPSTSTPANALASSTVA